jgi:menaquinone-dependent protoporphyrinogen oxidase
MAGEMGISRRGFLILTGGTVGASVLTYGRVSASGKQSSGVKFIESACEKDGKMENKILIAYASRCGSTGGVAERIGQTLCGQGAAVDVRLVGNVKDIKPYQSVILGSAIRMGKWLPEEVKFVKTHQEALSRLPVVYFAVCLTMKEDTAEKRSEASAYLDPVRNEFPRIKPVDIGLFAGMVDYHRLSFAYGTILKLKKIPSGDFRNWEAVNAWAAKTGPLLQVK